MDLCHARNHVGALIIVHWAVLLARNTAAWWLRGWLFRLIRACEELLAPTPELLKWLDWPIEMSKQDVARIATSVSARPSPMVLTPADATTAAGTPPTDTKGTVEVSRETAQT